MHKIQIHTLQGEGDTIVACGITEYAHVPRAQRGIHDRQRKIGQIRCLPAKNKKNKNKNKKKKKEEEDENNQSNTDNNNTINNI